MPILSEANEALLIVGVICFVATLVAAAVTLRDHRC